MFGPSARYMEKGNVFRFTNGAKLVCAYLENENDAANFQGWSLTRVYFDELTQLNSIDPVMALLATLRSLGQVAVQYAKAMGLEVILTYQSRPHGQAARSAEQLL